MVKNILFTFLFLSLGILSYSQHFLPTGKYLVDSLNADHITPEELVLIDSAIHLYHQAKTDTDKVNALNIIVEQSWNADIWPRYNAYMKSIIESNLQRDQHIHVTRFLQKEYANALNNEGLHHRNLGNLSYSLQLFEECLKIQQELKIEKAMATTLNNVGMIYLDYGDIEKALDYYFQSLKKEEIYGDSMGVAISLNNIGFIYYNQNDRKNALNYFSKSYEYLSKLNQKQASATILNNIGGIFKDLKQDKCDPACMAQNNRKAISYFNRSIAIQQQINDQSGLARSYDNKAAALESLHQLDSAFYYSTLSLTIRRALNEKTTIPNSLHTLTAIYLARGELKEAKASAIEAYTLSQELKSIDRIKQGAQLLSRIAQKNEDWKSAFYYINQYWEINDSLINGENKKAALNQELKYKFEKERAIQNTEFEHQLSLDKALQKKQEIIIYAVAIILIIILFFSILLFKRLRWSNTQNKIIEETNEELNQTNEEILAQRDELERQKELVDIKNQEITSSIAYAKRIQQAILPPADTLNKYLVNGFVLYQPKDVVAGDFYWLETRDDLVFFAVADCTGHGVPGAMVSVVCNGALNRCIREYKLTKPSDILDKTRELVITTFEKSQEQVKDGMDICLCVWNKKTNDFQYAGANAPLYILENGKINMIKADRQSIGYTESATPFTNHIIDLKAAKSLYLFTDGFADQFGGPKGKKIGYKNLREKLIEISDATMNVQKEKLEHYLNNWKGDDDQVDDICIIGIHIN